MAALSITTTQVLPTVNDPTVAGIAGEAIAVGQAVYYDAATGEWLKAQCDGTAAEAGAGCEAVAVAHPAGCSGSAPARRPQDLI